MVSLLCFHIRVQIIIHFKILTLRVHTLYCPLVTETGASTMSVELLLEGVATSVGEGPHWDNKTQSLLFVDLRAATVYRWESISGKLESRKLGIKVYGTYLSCSHWLKIQTRVS